MLQNAPNCTIKTNILGEACPRTPLANAWLRHASQAASRHAIRPAPQKVGPPGKSCIRPYVHTNKKSI